MAEVTHAVRTLVHERDGARCLGCGISRPLNIQHRCARGMGGRFGTAVDPNRQAPNLMLLCGSGTTGCHGWATHHPSLATILGWSIPMGTITDPEQVPALVFDGNHRQWRAFQSDGVWRYVDRADLPATIAARVRVSARNDAPMLVRLLDAPFLGAD